MANFAKSTILMNSRALNWLMHISIRATGMHQFQAFTSISISCVNRGFTNDQACLRPSNNEIRGRVYGFYLCAVMLPHRSLVNIEHLLLSRKSLCSDGSLSFFRQLTAICETFQCCLHCKFYLQIANITWMDKHRDALRLSHKLTLAQFLLFIFLFSSNLNVKYQNNSFVFSRSLPQVINSEY